MTAAGFFARAVLPQIGEIHPVTPLEDALVLLFRLEDNTF